MTKHTLNQRADQFIEHLEIDSLFAESSVASYRNALNQFAKFLRAASDSPEVVIDLNSITQFLMRQTALGYKRRTVAFQISVLRSFFRWQVDNGHIASNPITLLEPLKWTRTVPHVLTEDEITHLINAPGITDPCDVRDSAILALLADSGIRASELCTLTMRDLNLDGMSLSVHGKRGTVRHALFQNRTSIYLTEWLRQRPAFAPRHPFLFCSYRGRKLARSTLYYIVNEYGSLIGINWNVGPHTLRHSFATNLINRGMDLRALQTLLGHASILTTQFYTHIAVQRLTAAHAEFHPRS